VTWIAARQVTMSRRYFFNGGEYSRYDIGQDPVDIAFSPSVSCNWPALPTRLPYRPHLPLRFPVRLELTEEVSTPFSTGRFSQLVRSGQATQAITEAIHSGVVDAVRLTDMVFYARHPELNGRKIRPEEHALTHDWLQIRASVVQPALSRWHRTRGGPSSAAPASITVTQAPSGPAFLGLDTFGLDGNKIRNWAQARDAASINFAIFRSNWGTSIDTAFHVEWQRMKDAGLVRGAFLFLRFPHPQLDRKYGSPADPVAQATALTKTLPLGLIEHGDFPPALDVEFPGGRGLTGMSAEKCLQQVRTAWRVLKNYYGVAPIIYTSERVWREELRNLPASDLLESPLWLAYYPFKKGPARRGAIINRVAPPVPSPWGDSTNWWIHQYQGDATGLPGFALGNVDMNRFNSMITGAIGDRVLWVQRRLGIAQSGSYDTMTQNALRVFQRRNSLSENAIIDPRTFAHLCWSNP